LASYFHTACVPEYARIYLEENGGSYHQEDLLKIAKGQCALEDEMKGQADRILICDTELTVIKIWSDYTYNHCDEWIINERNVRNYDLYLLMDIDLPWEYDPLREHPDKREYFFNLFREELRAIGRTFFEISGQPEHRLQKAISLIDRQLFF